MAYVIIGWTQDDKVPAVVGETIFGTGRMTVGSQASRCLVTGNMLTTGTATPDQDVLRIYSEQDADTYFGAGCEMAAQCYAALLVPGVDLWAAPPAENGTAAAATFTIEIGGSWTANGQLGFGIGRWDINVATGADIETTSNNIADAINSDPHCWCTAVADTSSPYTVTATSKSKGARMLNYYVKKDESKMPAGMTCTVAGGTPTASGLVPTTGGSGVDTMTTLLALSAITSEEFGLVGCAQNETVAAQAWKTHMDAQAGPLIGHLEHLVFAHNGTETNATTLAQTDLNAYRAQVLWARYNRAHPSEIAAYWAAYRSVVEQSNPNPNYDDVEIKVCTAQEPADIPLHAEKKSALNNGLSPVTTTNGKGTMVRSIVSHCLSGAIADYRCLDSTDASVPDRIRKELTLEAIAWRAANPYVQDDPAVDEPELAEGIGTPSMWNARVVKVMRRAERDKWVTDVTNNMPTSEWDDVGKRIMTACPVVVLPKNHQIGISVRQVAA
jgi:phage tail sheath gpL-like